MLAQRPLIDISATAWNDAMRDGDFRRAWAISDAVLAARDPATRDDPHRPYHERWVWDGRPLAGRVIVRCYHGLGDTLQFCRYLRPLRSRCHVTLEVQAELAGLLAGWADVVHPFDHAAPLPPGDADIEIMELAHALRMVPDPQPYLHAAPSSVRGVGVCWQASGWDPGRNMPVTALAPLSGHPSRPRLVSLQRGAAAAEVASIGAEDPLDGAMDLGLMAQLVAGLDRVITIDTMIAHLAGALGRPTTVLLQQEADWRWGRGSLCPWYASVRAIRQPAPGVWDGMAEQALAGQP